MIRKDLLYDAELPQFDNLTEAMEQGWRSCMIVPMFDPENGFVGVLSLYHVEVGKLGRPMASWWRRSPIGVTSVSAEEIRRGAPPAGGSR